jgi:transcription elongation factor GreA
LVAKEIVLTREGYEKLKTELEELMTSRRAEVAARIAQAREFGDISENSEYDDAKNEQAMLEQQIAQLEERLRDARVIEEGELPSDLVALGSHVTIDGPLGKETYQLVGSAEADPDENRLSNESPIGRAILGRKKGDKVDVTTPGGQITVKIADISVS